MKEHDGLLARIGRKRYANGRRFPPPGGSGIENRVLIFELVVGAICGTIGLALYFYLWR